MTDLTDNIHGQLGESPNKLYKSYVSWFKKTYSLDKKPLTFKAWLKWAREKKIVLSADGDDGMMKTLEVKIREIQIGYVLVGMAVGGAVGHFMKKEAKVIGMFVAGGAVLGAVVSLLIPKVSVASESESKGGSGGGGSSSYTRPGVNPSVPPVIVISQPRRIVRAAQVGAGKTQSQSGTVGVSAPIPIQTATSSPTSPVGTNVPTGGNAPSSNTATPRT